MDKIQIITKENQKELKEHGNFSFPVNVSVEKIETYENGSFLWHWHPEIELTWIMSGEIEYQVNDTIYILHEGDALFGNSNAVHTGRMIENQECTYLSITFHPRFLYGYENSILQTKYVDMITSNDQWASIPLKSTTPWQKDIIDSIKAIYRFSKELPVDFEFCVHTALLNIWHQLYLFVSKQPKNENKSTVNIQRLRNILTYIQEHFNEEIFLDDIADTVNICKSECCRFFKKHMNMTIFDYILYYRIQKSLPLLLENLSITEVASFVGFSTPSYYTQIFKRYLHVTPMQYRKEKRNAS